MGVVQAEGLKLGGKEVGKGPLSPPPAFTALAYIPFKLHVAVTQFQPFLITLE